MQVQANGITFRCEVEGREGAPWVVFSNSLATNLGMWDDQAARLRERFRILRYDQRGHGGTQATPAPYDFDLLIGDVLGLFDALGIDRAHFVGISMGGMTALGLAERHPDRVRSIVPCDCSAASTPASAKQWEERIAVARAQGMEALVEPTLGRWFPAEGTPLDPAVRTKVAEMVRTTPVEGFAGCTSAISNFDFQPGLGTIARPTLVIVGTKDAMYGGSKEAAARIPGAKLVELEGAGHLANLSAPEAYTRALENFLASA